jgi:NADH-quinone oxidoreductase subunit M
MTLTLLAAMELPGTIGFIAELHTLIGGFQEWGSLIIFFGLSILISAAYSMRTIGIFFTGPIKPTMKLLPDLNTTELLASVFLVTCIILLGLLPTSLIELSAATIEQINNQISQRLL